MAKKDIDAIRVQMKEHKEQINERLAESEVSHKKDIKKLQVYMGALTAFVVLVAILV